MEPSTGYPQIKNTSLGSLISTIVLQGFSQPVSLHCPFNALHQLLKLALSCKPTIKQPFLSTALKMADNNSHQLLETLASNPKVLEKLSEALLPTLTKQMRTSQGQEGNRSAGDNGSMVDHVSNSNDNSRDNEANISSTNPPANSEANQQGEIVGNGGGNDPCGNEANHSGNKATWSTGR